ncbi:MAG: C25 family cysteine peptidase, partial [Dehalococcoidia bacterium]|nr:C25 family cysteine peptidase [Dehalococcoidia bacterium]
MATKILSGICTLILCFVLLPTNISCQGYPASSEEAITINYDFPEPRVEETWEIPPPKGALPVTEGYVSVTMEGLPQWSEPGLPVLPFKTASVLLPYGFDIERITVTCGNKVALPGSYMVEPGQEAVPLSYEGSVNVTPPDPGVYDSSAPFPGKLYSGAMVQNKSGYRILLVNLHPVEYISERGQLSYYETMTIQVTLRASGEGEWQGVSHLAQDEDVVREMVDNPETIRSYHAALPSFETLSLLAPGDYEYVIITSEALNATPGPDNFQALRDEKISRGITATIVTTEWIYANYPGTRPDEGADNQTRIRNFIIDAYNTWGTKYVLLGGDGDGADVGGESGDDIIPHRGFASLGDSDIPADMYYACLDGTFDDDADGVYGEPNDGPGGGEVDLFAEVYVGRAPVDSEAEVQNFVGKTLAYQSMAMTDENLRKVWMVGEKLDSATWGGDYKDEIKEGSSAHGNTTVGFEDSNYTASFDVSTLYDRDYPGHNWPKSEIVGIINDNAHLVNHLGHANVGYAMKMYNTDVDGLTNEELYFIGYSQGCYNGAFDNRDDYGEYTSYDCISEHLTTEPHGAVAFIANSRYGWYSPGSTDG